MGAESTTGICVVTATEDGNGVRFSVVGCLDTATDANEYRCVSQSLEDVLAEVRLFLRAFTGRHLE